jgi:hypothetical protein
MRLFLVVVLFLFGFSITSYAQEDYEYLGVIKLNDTSYISYKITFEEVDGLLSGYSVTDIGGTHETKSFISGFFDAEENSINFYESGILYTKSPVTQDDFCFVHFDGKLKQLDTRQGIEGFFEGLYSNGERCINGSISLLNFRKILKRARRLDNKIDRMKLISKEKRDKVNLVQELDSVNMNVIKKGERLSVFSKSDTVNLAIFDAGQEDGDRISILVNRLSVLNNYTVSALEKTVRIPLDDKETIVKIMALNNGTIGSNTVKVDIAIDGGIIETITNMKGGESAELVFIRSH